MKNLFSFNVKTNEIIGQEFLIRKPDKELSEKSDECADALMGYEKKGGMPLWYTIIEYILLFAAIICLPGFFRGCLDNGFDVAYRRGAAILIVGVIALVAGLVMLIIKYLRHKKVEQSPEVHEALSEMSELTDKIKESLLVPENSADTDILCRPFKLKKGKVKRGSHFFDCFNFSFWVFVEGENLCLANADGVYGIPLSSITDAVKIKKAVTSMAWNKDETVKDPKYKQFVKVNNYGLYFFKPHYSLRFKHNDEEWEILIPGYEMEVISSLTGKYPAK